MGKQYVVVDLSKAQVNLLKENNTVFIDTIASVLEQTADFKVDDVGNIKLNIRDLKAPVLSSLPTIKTENFQLIVEFDETTKQIIAIHDPFFADCNGVPSCIDLTHLTLHKGKYAQNDVSRKRFFDTFAYGMLKEMADNNPAQKDKYQRCLALSDYLYKNPPKELYRITSKKLNAHKMARYAARKAFAQVKNNNITPTIEKHLQEVPLIPQINYDDFTLEEIQNALKNYGSFELIGPTVERLRGTFNAALKSAKQFLTVIPELTDEEKKPIENQNFNGFQDVKKQSQLRAAKGEGVVRNQIAYHYKPYLPPRVPTGLDISDYKEYYEQGIALLHSFYRKIMMILKVDHRRFSPFENDQKSVLITRRYFSGTTQGTGIPEHSDYGKLTLVASDEPGLEIRKKDGKWVSTSGSHFYINPGDWFRLQTGDHTFMPGLHRVPEIQAGRPDRFSVILALNPNEDEKIKLESKFLDLYLNVENKEQLLAQFQNFKQEGVTDEVAYHDFLENYRSTDTNPYKTRVKKT